MTRFSHVWSHFSIANKRQKKAECKYCQKTLSYKTTITNLKHHLKQKHLLAFQELCKDQDIQKITATNTTDDDSNSSVEIPAEVWNYFERDAESDPGRARCVVCDATVSLLDMVEHMKSEHPKVNTKAEFVTEEFEVEEEALNDSKEKDAFDTEIIYVQDNQGYKKTPTAKRRQSRNFNVDRKRISKYSYEDESTDGVPSKSKEAKQQDKGDEEIDKFTTYVTCLLKQLPKDVCAKLQMDIINLIMTEKLKIGQRNATETPRSTPSNMITVTSVDGTYMLVPPSVEKSVTVPTSETRSDKHNASGRTDPTADS